MKDWAWKIGLFGCLLLALSARAQEPEVCRVYEVEKAPSFPGGEKAMLQFIGERLHLIRLSNEQNPPGSARISFIVETDGSLSEIESLRPGILDSLLIAIFDSMPCWTPGEDKGQIVRTRYTLPISCIKWE